MAFGPALFALTKPLVKRRVARNESIAAIRFASLKKAVELTMADRGAAGSICDEQSLRKHYSGPPFTQEDWRRIFGNYVEEDKYVYMISCLHRGNICLRHGQKSQRFTAMVFAHSAPTSRGK
jgi:hypothetical protein